MAGWRGGSISCYCRAGARRCARPRCGLEFGPADAAPEHVVGPGLVDEHHRQQDDRDDAHHFERVRRRCGAVDRQVVGRAGGGDHHVGVQADEDRHDAGRDRDRGRGEGEAVAMVVDQPERGAPKMFPTSREYAPQSIPNWNSCTSPVTTPIATLITSSVPKNRVSRRYSSCLERYHAVCSSAVRNASPIVTGTKKKWLIEVNAN